MRKIFTTTFLTLDGVMQDPHLWSFPCWNDQIAQYKFQETMGSDALLLGRVTYEGFAQAWPGRTDEQGFADRYNSFPKYVVSTTLETADWNNSHIIRDNVAEEIRETQRGAWPGHPGFGQRHADRVPDAARPG
jgi:dihydrofolate reductase